MSKPTRNRAGDGPEVGENALVKQPHKLRPDFPSFSHNLTRNHPPNQQDVSIPEQPTNLTPFPPKDPNSILSAQETLNAAAASIQQSETLINAIRAHGLGLPSATGKGTAPSSPAIPLASDNRDPSTKITSLLDMKTEIDNLRNLERRLRAARSTKNPNLAREADSLQEVTEKLNELSDSYRQGLEAARSANAEMMRSLAEERRRASELEREVRGLKGEVARLSGILQGQGADDHRPDGMDGGLVDFEAEGGDLKFRRPMKRMETERAGSHRNSGRSG